MGSSRYAMRKPGLRLQLLLLLGGLLVVTFVPLQLALSTYTQVTLRQLDDAQARAASTALTAYVQEARPRLTASALLDSLEEKFAPTGLVAARVTAPSGDVQAERGDEESLAWLARVSPDAAPDSSWLRASKRRLLAWSLRDQTGVVQLAVNAGQASSRGGTLIGMFALYAFLIASSLLLLAYFALTRLIVRPLDRLSQSAQNVTLGKRQLELPVTAVRELGELGEALQRMTHRLLSEEESLRNKIAEVERATLGLKEAQHQLVRSERMASVGRLAAGLAHEIGNPIAAVMGLLDLLLEDDLSASERRDFVRRMKSETERIHRTLRDLLDFARAPAAQGSGERGGEVEAAVHDTATLVSHQASMKNLELKIDVHPGLPRVTLGSEQLMQVLLNLVLNAADALDGAEGGWVSIVARAKEGCVSVEVCDNGPGVDPGVVEQIFEPFFTTTEVGKGTGLGLSVCQGLVEGAGGSLELDRARTEGARFEIRLPRHAPNDTPKRDN